MASPAHFLRLCLRARRPFPNVRTAAAQRIIARRPLSTTPWRARQAPVDEAAEDEEPEEEFDQIFQDPGEVLSHMIKSENTSDELRQQANDLLKSWKKLPPSMRAEYRKLKDEITEESESLRRPERIRKDSFWNEDEDDPDMVTNEIGEDDFEEDDMMAMAHPKLEEHREFREYARIAVWEMPLLSKLAKPFEPPTEDQVLRFRYTTYMGETHPADRKVVVEFSPRDLTQLSEAQQLKLKKLAGPRYNPEKDIVKMSCERFEHQAQNKRYLGDLVNKMIETAKDPTDMFEDVPLDTRHHKFKTQIKFPKEWYLTEERKKALEAQRMQALLLDERKRADGTLVDGTQTIEHALVTAAPVLEPVLISRGRSSGAAARPGGRR